MKITIAAIFSITILLCISCGKDSTVAPTIPNNNPDTTANPPDTIPGIPLQDLFPQKSELSFYDNVSSNGSGEFFISGRPSTACFYSPPDMSIYCSGRGTIIQKFNSNKELRWTFSLNDNLVAVAAEKNGGCCIALNSRANDLDFGIIYLDNNGVEKWFRTVGGKQKEYVTDIISMTDQNIVCVGKTESFGSTSFGNLYTVKLNQNGDTIWTRVYEEPDQELASCVLETRDNGIVVVGQNSVPNENKTSLLVIKYSTDGDLLWAKNHLLDDWTVGLDAVEAMNGDIYITGQIYESYTWTKMLLTKLDSNGEVVWFKELDPFNVSVSGLDIEWNGNDELISIGRNLNNIFMASYNLSGDQNWLVEYNLPNPQNKADLLVLPSEFLILYNTSVLVSDTIVAASTYLLTDFAGNIKQ